MPFDFYSYKPYSINYSTLFEQINSKRIFDNQLIQSQYANEWLNLLIRHDDIVVKQFSTQKQIADYQKLIRAEPEIFQHPMHFSNTNIFIHFRASIANEIVIQEKPKSSSVCISEFIKHDTIYKWTPVGTNVDSYSSNNTPIIIVPFYNGQYSFLVIDGNHRLTYKTKNNKPNIDVLIFSEQSVINYSIFSSSFDKFYYIMHNEICHIIDEKLKYNTNDYSLIRKSYLNDGTFKFI
jgi:hypothetical protein